MNADFHIHTTASDGTLSPAGVVHLAAQKGLAAIAVTDHDTMAGVAEARAAGMQVGVRVVPGIELSAGWHGDEIHLLGYFQDPGAPALRRVLAWARDERDVRNGRMAARLRAAGFDVSIEALSRTFPGTVLGRPHLAARLVELGAARSVSDAFARMLGEGKPFYEPRQYLPFTDAAEAIRTSGGAAVLAHPLKYGYDAPVLRALCEEAAALGVIGLECFYYGYSPAQTELLSRLAAEFDFVQTGGSDFHGAAKPDVPMTGMADAAVADGLLRRIRGDAR